LQACNDEQSLVSLLNLGFQKKADAIHILHVDDDISMLEVSKQILLDMDSSFEIDSANCVDEALEKLAKQNYDLIVSDFEMPQKNGLDFLKLLKYQKILVPFILFTGKGREEIAIQALNLGADGYYNKQGSPETVYGELSHGIKAIVERNRAKTLAKASSEALKQSNERVDKIINSIPDGICAVDKDWNFAYVNQKIANIVNCVPNQMVGKNAWTFFQMLIGTVFEEKVREAMRESKFIAFDFKGIISGAVWEALVYPSDNGLIIVTRDITERKKAELELEQKYEALERVAESVSAGLAIISRDYTVFWANSALKNLGVSPNKKCYQTFNNIETVCPDCGVKKVFEQKVPFDSHEYKTVNSKGEIVWVELRVSPLKDKDGNVTAALELVVPITDRKTAEEKLKQSNQTVNAIINNTYDGIYALDKNWNFIYVNDQMAKLVNCQPDQMVGKNGWSFFPKLLGTTFEKNLRQAMEKQERRTFEWAGFYADKIWEINVIPTPEGIIVSARDVTELKLSESRFRSLYEESFDGIIIADTDGANRFANPSACRMLQMSEDEIRKTSRADLVVFDERLQKALEERERTGKARAELTLKRKDGTTFEADVTSVIFKDTDSTVKASMIIRDVTERKKHEEVLSSQNALFESILASVNEGVFSVDTNYNHTSFNKQHAQVMKNIYGVNIQVGGNLLEYQTNPIDRRIARENIDRALGGEFVIDEKASGDEKLSRRWFEVRHCPVRNGKGEVTGVAIFSRDTTQRKKAQEELLSAEEKFRTIFENVYDVITYVDTHGKILDVNNRVEDLLGYKREEIIGMNFTKLGLVQFTDAPKLMKLFIATIRKREPQKLLELELKHKSGKKVSVEVGTRFIKDKNGKIVGVVNIFRDITARKNAEDALKQSDKRYREFADSLPEIVFETNEKGIPTYVNRKAMEIMGYSLDEVSDVNFLEFIEAKDRQRAQANVQKIMNGEKLAGTEYTLRRKDGTTFPAMIFAELTNIGSNAHGLRGIVVNISESKNAAEKLAVVNEKLQVVGGLTRHDVRNKLSAINGLTYLIKKRFADNDEALKLVSQIDSAVKSASCLLDFSATYEKIGSEKIRPINAGQCFDEAAALFPDLGKVKVINECDDLELKAGSLLRQLFYNLIDNTLKHGEKVTQIILRYQQDSDGTKLIYEDNGVGISTENKSRLFSEGFSTGKSSGLGLFLIKKLVEAYGWSITEEGKPREGARFLILIPNLGKARQ